MFTEKSFRVASEMIATIFEGFENAERQRNVAGKPLTRTGGLPWKFKKFQGGLDLL